ncbi:MAG TPA: NmrA family NAD(P)-binding protein [Casimicrobiaceae bacterium]|nr:NmrA family NAD(P)-binding protein [Casimicrobiaceae bacterium]
MIVVIGASGYLGGYTVRRLLAAGNRVRAASRSPDRLAALGVLGAEIVRVDLVDEASMDAACRDVDAVFVAAHSLMGVGKYASAAVDDRGHRSLIDAARRAGVGRFVYTSAMFASSDHPVDFMRTKANVEAALTASGLRFSILRPSAFMEWHVHNLLGKPLVDSGKTTIFGKGITAMNFVAADDVAAVATEVLRDPHAVGQTVEIGGPDNVTRNDVAAMYEQRLGRSVVVRHVPLGPLRIVAPAVRPFNPVIARLMDMALWGETGNQTFDFAGRRERYARPVTHVAEFVASQFPGRSTSAAGGYAH